MATKSQVLVAMSSTALRCLSMLRPPSYQVTSTPSHLLHCSVAALPCAGHELASPALTNAALSCLPKGKLPPLAAPASSLEPCPLHAASKSAAAAAPPSMPRRPNISRNGG